ncbi:MAG: cysteine--tRNA ligase [Coprobacillus sp.]|nr:cysteine--tRNA ligase [Coprobacillus sp.]
MTLKLYNSLTSKVETFKPIKEGEVSMYVCGPTVYNHPHIGNMRPVVVFDVLRSLLEYLGYKVTYVSNYTDVDDKIINEALKEGISEKELTDFYISEFNKTVKDIGSRVPTVTPRVTEYMDQIIAYIDNLLKTGYAYNVNGNVYFDVSKIKDYGTLSHTNIDDLLVGARIEENDEKKSPLDFALWKKTDVGIKWSTPWGEGRPGWHTECCVMIDSIFNHQTIDIHGGGYDLKFPHHDNEIAQIQASDHHPLANYWVHNSFINIENEKMSKSLGNVLLAKDLIDEYGGNVIRLVILSTNYRQTVNFKDDVIKNSQNEINRLKATYKSVRLYVEYNKVSLDYGYQDLLDSFIEALCDDLNTANALAVLYSTSRDINTLLKSKEIDRERVSKLYLAFNKMLEILGLDLGFTPLSKEDLKLYQDYLDARKDNNYTLSDKLREQLLSKDIL